MQTSDYAHTLHTVRFDRRDFLTLDFHLGDGVAYKHVGIYAPEDDGTFRLCLFAESIGTQGSTRRTNAGPGGRDRGG